MIDIADDCSKDWIQWVGAASTMSIQSHGANGSSRPPAAWNIAQALATKTLDPCRSSDVHQAYPASTKSLDHEREAMGQIVAGPLSAVIPRLRLACPRPTNGRRCTHKRQ